MDIRASLRERWKEIKLAKKYWSPIVLDSIISSISWWVLALGLVFVATLVSMAITFKKEEVIEMSSFFPPNFGWGVLIVLGVILLYQLIIEVARAIEKYRLEADKFTWKDVAITITPPDPEDPPTSLLTVINKKPYDIDKVHVKIIDITIDWLMDLELKNRENPLNLGWLTAKEDPFFGNEVSLKKNGEENDSLAFVTCLPKVHAAFILAGYRNNEGKNITDHYFLKPDLEYRIQLEWFGDIEEHQLDRYTKTYFMKFDGEKIELRETR